MSGGRPSKFSPAYCEEAISCLAEGRSVTAFAGRIGVARSTVFKWAEEHPEFSDAIKVGQAKATDFWEGKLVNLADGKPGNATAVIFGLKNRASDDWSDMTRTEVTGKDGKDILPTDQEFARELLFVVNNMLRLTEKPST